MGSQPESRRAPSRAFVVLALAGAAAGLAASPAPASETARSAGSAPAGETARSAGSAPASGEARGAAIDSLEALMQELARTDSMRARYTEQKHLALLREPLESEGVVYFVRPDRFARHTTRPGRASLVIHGQQLHFRDETGEDRIDLGQSDVAQQLVGSLIDVLRGDQGALEASYRVRFETETDGAGEERWRLHLAPRSRRVARFVEGIDIRGAGRVVASMALHEPNGDRTVTRFSGFETGLGLSEEELDALFSLARRAPDG